MKTSKVISKKNLVYNLNQIKQKTNKKIVAVVKANAYGHGIYDVAKCVEGQVCAFAVASVSEGIELRKILPNKKIIVLEPVEKKLLRIAIKHRLEMIVESSLQLEQIALLRLKRKAYVHFKLDCGMHRFGFENEEEIKNSLKIIDSNSAIELVGVCTHFSCAKQKNLFQSQQSFETMLSLFSGRNVFVHVGGSMATKLNESRFDGIRIGLSMYGFAVHGSGLKLKPALSINSKIITIKTLEKGQKLGYDGTFVAKQKCRVACCKFGYADGVSKSIEGSNYSVKISKEKCKIIGKVCMDCFFVLLGDGNYRIGQNVKLFCNAKQFAKAAKISVYECLTNFNKLR